MILGIESTAHTFGCGVCHDRKLLSNIMDTFKPPVGGIRPSDAAEHHAKVAAKVVSEALEAAGTSASELDAVAYARGPGLGPCLAAGLVAARTLAIRHGIPLVPVNHCIAHIEVGRLACGIDDPVTLYVSGGNTQVIAYEEQRYRVFGETLDIPIGNLFDQFCRYGGLPHPGGPAVERMAREAAEAGADLIELPYVVKGMDLSYSGILSDIKRRLADGADMKALCMSVQEVSFAMLTEVTERAMAHTQKQDAMLVGGVAANKRLFEMVSTMAHERGGDAYVVPWEYAGDNGTMIALVGEQMYETGIKEGIEDSFTTQRFRTDEVEVTWI